MKRAFDAIDTTAAESATNTAITEEVPAAPSVNAVEVVITFDTTGSMYPCLTQVRKNVSALIDRLFGAVPGIRIGIIAHGDYGDKYVTKVFDLSVDRAALAAFVQGVEATNGGDWEECYELVLRQAHTDIHWSAVAKKVLVVIGDAVPHPLHSARNQHRIDWRTEAATLCRAGVQLYSVQCLGDVRAETIFWRPLATENGGVHLRLDQFANTADYIMAICYHAHSNEQLRTFRDEVQAQGGMSRSITTMFSTLLGEAPPPSSSSFSSSAAAGRPSSASGVSAATTVHRPAGLQPVAPSRFQVLQVGDTKVSIKQFALDNGLVFKVGRGFYELTKSETVSDKKEVVLQDRVTGDFFTGQEACDLIGTGGAGKVSGKTLGQWRVFVQSTSANRALVPHTGFLYEVDLSSVPTTSVSVAASASAGDGDPEATAWPSSTSATLVAPAAVK